MDKVSWCLSAFGTMGVLIPCLALRSRMFNSPGSGLLDIRSFHRKGVRWALLGIGLMLAGLFVIPVPIEGYWKPAGSHEICDDDFFVHFREGWGTVYDPREMSTPEFKGKAFSCAYRRIGWNAWRWDWFDASFDRTNFTWSIDTNSAWLIRPGWFSLTCQRPDGEEISLRRYWRLRYARDTVQVTGTQSQEEELDCMVARLRAVRMQEAGDASRQPPNDQKR